MKKIGIPKASEVKGALAPGLEAVIAHDCLTIWKNDREREWKWFLRKMFSDIVRVEKENPTKMSGIALFTKKEV